MSIVHNVFAPSPQQGFKYPLFPHKNFLIKILIGHPKGRSIGRVGLKKETKKMNMVDILSVQE
jgi:hypothetical protein